MHTLCFRHWLVVTGDGHQVTARQEPRLVLLSLSCQDGRLCLNAPGMEQLSIALSQPQNQVMNCRLVCLFVESCRTPLYQGHWRFLV